MRAFHQVIEAHDLISKVLSGELPGLESLSDVDQESIKTCVDVLCWILGHDNEQSKSFADNITWIKQRLHEPIH